MNVDRIVACGLMLLLTGCGAVESNWYPIQGGYINLRQVTNIETKFSMTLKTSEKDEDGNELIVRTELIAEDELITSDKIKKAKKRIREVTKEFCVAGDKKKPALNSISYSAAIVFSYAGGGTHTVKLQPLEDWSDNEDLYRLLDAWLSAVKELKLNLGRVIDRASD